jgi:O-acetyl-ADP-ribose deacetylase (regulator of RNase III)
MSKVSVSVVSGDIAQVKADALITAINSGGMWFGGIDGVIMRAAGNYFHQQAKRAMPLTDGQTVVTYDNGCVHHGVFTSVVFVVDDLKRPLHEIVYNGLKSASDAGFKSVSLPTIRMGVMLGLIETSVNEAVGEMAKGVKKFITESPDTSLKSITFVVYNNNNIHSLLQKALK